MQTDKVFEFESGDVQLWIELESIHLLARGKSHGDPVETHNRHSQNTRPDAERISRPYRSLGDSGGGTGNSVIFGDLRAALGRNVRIAENSPIIRSSSRNKREKLLKDVV